VLWARDAASNLKLTPGRQERRQEKGDDEVRL
jgi:hypothetical protein